MKKMKKLISLLILCFVTFSCFAESKIFVDPKLHGNKEKPSLANIRNIDGEIIFSIEDDGEAWKNDEGWILSDRIKLNIFSNSLYIEYAYNKNDFDSKIMCHYYNCLIVKRTYFDPNPYENVYDVYIRR